MNADPLPPDEKKVRLTERSLTEQMKITERVIEDRKKILGFDERDARLLLACKENIADNLDEITARFYERQRSIPEVELVIGDAETFNRLHLSMKRYVMELFEGFYDQEYVNKRLRIGKIHQRIGVTPTLYITAVTHLEELLQEAILTQTLKEKQSPADAFCDLCDERRNALRKLLMFDVQLVFDTYINSLLSQVEAAKDQVEAYAQGLEATVAERTRQLDDLSKTDGLTGLLNQRAFYSILRRECARAERMAQPLVLIYFDLNRFKKVNDQEGHKAGDALLALVGETLLANLREVDIAFR